MRQRPDDTLDLVELVGRPRRPVGARTRRSALDDVAFLTYTSGTTGPPKGAMNTHGNVVFNAEAYRTWMSLTPDDVVLGVAPLFHITGLIAHLAVALLVPMPIVLGYRFDPVTVLDLIEQRRPTFTVGAITVFIALMNDADLGRPRPVVAHQGLQRRRADRPDAWSSDSSARPGAYIHNIYGLTETTSPSHGVPMGARSPVDPISGALSVGVPIFNTVVRGDRRGGQRRRPAARSASSSPPDRRWWPATGTSPRRPRTRCPAAACTPATSASWTPTAGSTWSTARRT